MLVQDPNEKSTSLVVLYFRKDFCGWCSWILRGFHLEPVSRHMIIRVVKLWYDYLGIILITHGQHYFRTTGG